MTQPNEPLVRDGILIHEDGSLEIFRKLPWEEPDGYVGIDYLAVDLGEASLSAARDIWAEGNEDYGLPQLNPADAPIYRTRTIAEPISAADAEQYLAQIEQERDDAEGERAAEACEACGEE